MPSVRLYGKHCASVRFSPFFPQYLACVASENYGAGSLTLLENDNSNHLKVRRISYWPSGLSDVSWWKNNENILATGSCNGSVQLWKLFGNDSLHPLKVFREHTGDVSSVDSKHNLIATSSWDSTIKIWDVNSVSSVLTLTEPNGKGIVRSAKWADSFPNLLLSVSSDYHMILWDKNSPVPLVHKVESHNTESLDCDWNQFSPFEVGVCGSDSFIHIWDIRALDTPLRILRGHKKAVGKMKWFPHYPGIIGTASYDLSTAIWDVSQEKLLEVIQHHSAYIFGLDFSPLIPGLTADCSLDSLVHVFTPWSLHGLKCQQFLRNKL